MKTLYTISFIFLITTSGCNKAFSQPKNKKTLHQIQLLEKEKNARTAIERKIDSRLLQAIREKRGVKMAPGVDLLPANVNADEKGNLQVDINAEVNDELLNKIKKLGGEIIYPSKQYHTIRARINLQMVETIAGYSAVKFIEPATQAMNNSITQPGNILLRPAVSDTPAVKVRDK